MLNVTMAATGQGLSLEGFQGQISCIDMHTTGEPTRIVYAGYPSLQGTLLEQREMARSRYDHIRRRLILEPRGHHDMYGAILRPSTEKVEAGEADMGILFLTNDGYSNMCGHATLALGRFLIDTTDPAIFPKRTSLRSDEKGIHLRLHLPCGIVIVTVQTLPNGQSDPSKPVSFVSVPSFATGINVRIRVPMERRWRVGKTVSEVTVDFSFGGAFFCVVRASGVYDDREKTVITGEDLADLDEVAFTIMDLVNKNAELRKYVTPAGTVTAGLGKLYAVVIVFDGLGRQISGTIGVETGVCYFDNHQIDRSPTGSAAIARAALAHAKAKLALDEGWTYQSLVSNSQEGKGGFVSRIVEETASGVRVQLEGQAYYTGTHQSFFERDDGLGDDGFILGSLGPGTHYRLPNHSPGCTEGET